MADTSFSKPVHGTFIDGEFVPGTFYRIEITRVEHQPVTRREWQPHAVAGTAEKPDGFGYAEKRAIEKVERTLLKQELENVDIPAVIAAANGLHVLPKQCTRWLADMSDLTKEPRQCRRTSGHAGRCDPEGEP